MTEISDHDAMNIAMLAVSAEITRRERVIKRSTYRDILRSIRADKNSKLAETDDRGRYTHPIVVSAAEDLMLAYKQHKSFVRKLQYAIKGVLNARGQ